MKKLMRILTVIQVIYQGIQIYKEQTGQKQKTENA